MKGRLHLKRLVIIIFSAILFLGLLPAAGLAATTADIEAATALLGTYSSDELLQMWTQIGSLLRTNGTYPFSELERGDTGYEVTALQTQLAALGYYKKEIVSEFGNGTYNALREFEKATGLQVNGIASPEDQQSLYQAVAALAADAAPTGEDTYSAYSPEELLQMWVQISTALRYDGSYPYEELKKGDVGYEVTMLQTRLQELGYYQKAVVDNFGSGTYDALRDFEKQNGLKADGIASSQDQQLLFSSAAAAYVQQTTTQTNTDTNKNDGTSGATP
jgi:peptidoglycan hydrolase-like protein with peptidoglycan-binding domain